MKNHSTSNSLDMSELYDENYFERGLQLGISGYTSYSWMPDLTLKMAKFLIEDLKLSNQIVLDFGCAKGYLVKALRMHGINAYGYDASEYATSEAPEEIKNYCFCEKNYTIEKVLFENNINFVISKDVFEHLEEDSLIKLLWNIKNSGVNSIYVVVPISKFDNEKYIIQSYENDKTHILRKSAEWWEATLMSNLDFEIIMSSRIHGPVKENWTKTHKDGNLFILLKRRV